MFHLTKKQMNVLSIISRIIFSGIVIICTLYITPVYGQAFKHPGILNNASELDYIKQKANSGAQPWKKSFDALKSSPFSSLSYQANPKATMDCWSYNKDKNGNYVPQCKTFVHDAMAAYSAALMWYITDDKRYAAKSIQILNAWSNVYVSNTGSNARLNVAWAAPWFINAAEILRHGNAGGSSGWSQSDITKFNVMITKFLPYVKDENMPGNNWIQSAIEAHFAIAIFTDNRTEFNNAVGRWKTRVKTYIYQKSDGATPLEYPSGNVNINSSRWNGTKVFVDGLSMETCRDLGHMKLGVNSMMYAAQSAYEQGVDLFALEQKRLSDFLELHGSWMTGAKAVPSNINGGKVIVSPNTPGIKPPNGGGQAAFEIAYNHLHTRLNKNLPYTLQMINNNRPANAGQWVFKWETLTHGNLPFNINTTPPNQAPNVSVSSPQQSGTNYAAASITLNASATDDKGVTKVEFYNGAALLNSDATAPYTFNWANVGDGTHTITAKAYDANNASSVSAAITVSVIAKQVADYTPPKGFTLAVNENEMISVTDKVNIAYGANGTFVYLYNQTSSVGCSNDAFGSDPAYGIAKKCFVQKVITTPIVDYNPPAGYSVAVNEWGTVIVTGKMNIAYGANGTFTYLYNQTSNVACTNDAFGKDPITGIAKKCFVQEVTTTTQPPNTSVDGINGPACVEANMTYTYTVKPDNYTLKGANWWTNTGTVVSINPNNEGSMTMKFPSNKIGSIVTVTAGVNISVAPWYKEYSMQIKVGGCTGSSPQLRASASPLPFDTNTTLSLENDERITSILVLDINGREIYKAANIDMSTFTLGENFASGIYIAYVHSKNGVSIIKLIKNN